MTVPKQTEPCRWNGCNGTVHIMYEYVWHSLQLQSLHRGNANFYADMYFWDSVLSIGAEKGKGGGCRRRGERVV